MSCSEMMERLTDRLHGRLDERADRELSQHLAECSACRTEAEATESLWSRLGDLDAFEDVPSGRMRARLWAALSVHGDRPRNIQWLGLAAATLLVGVVVGHSVGGNSRGEIRALRGEMRSMQETITVSLLQHQSASERLRGVALSAPVGPDEAVIDALLDTVAHDTNVNVRLAAIEALAPVVARPPVQRELFAALGRKDSTLVRAGVAEVLLRSRVAGAEQAVNEFLAGGELDGPARDYLKALMRS